MVVNEEPVSGVLTVAMNVTNQPASNEGQELAAHFTQRLEQMGAEGALGLGQYGGQWDNNTQYR